ncbi:MULTISPECIES: DUF3291 domain-containing protein [Ruegeria]|uniref:DUF3291 domain-containing protein n=1 Tax=Ruegeria sp. HKCCD7303 TaxID=2683013 RepID=UPI0014801362|nr:DUF3291 domain-containing protein [Ruegeria sp. HKCCD7303]
MWEFAKPDDGCPVWAAARQTSIWPIWAGHIPSLTEGKERLLRLRTDGPSPEAYDFATGKDMVVK